MAVLLPILEIAEGSVHSTMLRSINITHVIFLNVGFKRVLMTAPQWAGHLGKDWGLQMQGDLVIAL